MAMSWRSRPRLKPFEWGFLILLVLILFDVTDMVLGPCVNFIYGLLVNGIIF